MYLAERQFNPRTEIRVEVAHFGFKVKYASYAIPADEYDAFLFSKSQYLENTIERLREEVKRKK